MKQYDVIIVGAGMVGLTLALQLVRSGLCVAVVDKNSAVTPVSGAPALRVSALSANTCQVLDELGAWGLMDQFRVGVYDQMEVWDQDSFGRIHFSADEVRASRLGCIVENESVVFGQTQALLSLASDDVYFERQIQSINVGQHEVFVQLDNGQALSGKLLVGADGHQSFIRNFAALPTSFNDYQQQAVVTTIRTELAHNNIARQPFTPTGPIGLLPLWEPNLLSIVWSQDTEQAKRLMELDDVNFSRRLQAHMNNQLGQVEVVDQRLAFALNSSFTRQWVKPRIAVIGDAAHRFHPLAGQGANLGMADAIALGLTIQSLHQQQQDFGLVTHLRQFERDRKNAAAKMIASMEGFKQLFSGSHPLKKLVRGAGLKIVDQLPTLKKHIIHHAMGETLL